MQIQQNVNEISLDSSGCYVPVRAARGDEGRERSLLAQCSQSPLLPQALCFHHPVCSPSEGGVCYIDMILILFYTSKLDHCQGLRTFNTPRYRQFAKRLGRLIRHTVGFYIWSRRSNSLSRFTMCLTTGRLSNWPRVMHWTHPCCCDCKSNMTTSSFVLQGRILGTHFFVQ